MQNTEQIRAQTFLKRQQDTHQRVETIQRVVGERIEAERQSHNFNPRNDRLMKYICEKTEILINFIHTGKVTQKRLAVTEQYLQELEVLLGLDT